MFYRKDQDEHTNIWLIVKV